MKDFKQVFNANFDTDTGYLVGKARNEDIDGDGTGSPWHQIVINDLMMGPVSALFNHSDVVADNSDEKAGQSQWIDALKTLAKDMNWGDRFKGSFEKGFTYTSADDVGRGQDGEYYKYIGSDPFPKSVPAGLNPASFPNEYVLSKVTDHNNGTNRNAVGAHDDIYARQVNGIKNIIDVISTLSYGSTVETKSFYQDKYYGGCKYLYENEPASKHMTLEGSKIFIAISAIQSWDGTQANINDLLNWPSDTSTGCLSFDISEHDLTHFGAIKDDITKDNIIAAQKSTDVLGYVIIPTSETPLYLSAAINVTGFFDFNIKAKNRFSNVFDGSKGYPEQSYLSKVYAPNGLLHNVYDEITNQDRCREYLDSIMVYGDRSAGSVCLKGRAANNINNSLLVNFEKIIENDFAFLSTITNSRFDRCDYFAHVATANGFNITDSWFGSGIVKGIDSVDLTLGVNAIATSYPMSITRCNINCGSNTDFIVRSRGVFDFKGNYVECFSDTNGDSLFLVIADRFGNGAFNIAEGNEINAQNHTAYLVKFYGNNAAGTQNFKGYISKQNRIIGFTSPTPVLVGWISPDYPSASTEVFEVVVDYPISVDRAGNFNNYDGRISCADSTDTSFTGTSFTDLPITVISPTGTDAVSGNILTKRSAGDYRCKAEVQVKTPTTLRNMEVGIFVNGTKVAGVITSIVVDAAVTGDYYETVIVEANPLTLSRSDDVQIRGRNGGVATVTKVWLEKI